MLYTDTPAAVTITTDLGYALHTVTFDAEITESFDTSLYFKVVGAPVHVLTTNEGITKRTIERAYLLTETRHGRRGTRYLHTGSDLEDSTIAGYRIDGRDLHPKARIAYRTR